MLTTPTGSLSPAVAVFATASSKLLGFIPLPTTPTGFIPQAIAAGVSGKLLIAGVSTLVELDASNPIQTTPTAPVPTLSPDSGVAAAPAPVVLSTGKGQVTAVYFGQAPAPILASSPNSLTVQPPPSTPGIVSVSLLLSDGTFVSALNAYSFGPAIQHISVTAGASSGGTIVTLYGLGLGTQTSLPTITIGGAAATVTAINTFNSHDVVTFKTPSGSVGPADLVLTSYAGSVTRPSAFLYCSHSPHPLGAPLPDGDR